MLNEFGRRFQSNGYQLPGTIETTPMLIYLLLEHSENIFHILLPLSLTQLKVEVMKQQLKLPM
jgi:hypothetical protein